MQSKGALLTTDRDRERPAHQSHGPPGAGVGHDREWGMGCRTSPVGKVCIWVDSRSSQITLDGGTPITGGGVTRMGGDFFRLRALLRVAPGPQGHARPDLRVRLSHRLMHRKSATRSMARARCECLDFCTGAISEGRLWVGLQSLPYLCGNVGGAPIRLPWPSPVHLAPPLMIAISRASSSFIS